MAQRLLVDVHDVFSASGIRYTLDYGTLLGLVRDGGLIPWDNDIDLAIGPEDVDGLMGAAAELRARGLIVDRPDRMRVAGPGFGASDPARFRLVSKGGALTTSGIVAMDVVAKYPHAGRVHWALVASDRRVFCVASEHFYEGREQLAGLDRPLPVPVDAERYLEHVYGDGRTPRPDYDAWRDDGSIAGRIR